MNNLWRVETCVYEICVRVCWRLWLHKKKSFFFCFSYFFLFVFITYFSEIINIYEAIWKKKDSLLLFFCVSDKTPQKWLFLLIH